MHNGEREIQSLLFPTWCDGCSLGFMGEKDLSMAMSLDIYRTFHIQRSQSLNIRESYTLEGGVCPHALLGSFLESFACSMLDTGVGFNGALTWSRRVDTFMGEDNSMMTTWNLHVQRQSIGNISSNLARLPCTVRSSPIIQMSHLAVQTKQEEWLSRAWERQRTATPILGTQCLVKINCYFNGAPFQPTRQQKPRHKKRPRLSCVSHSWQLILRCGVANFPQFPTWGWGGRRRIIAEQKSKSLGEFSWDVITV